MLRVGEWVGVLAPIAAIAILWFAMAKGRRIPRGALFLAVLFVAGLGVWWTWLGTSERLDPGERYVPAVLHGGVVVQGHGQPAGP